eukprot:PhF_6_TR6555/c0_g1_i1/m.9693
MGCCTSKQHSSTSQPALVGEYTLVVLNPLFSPDGTASERPLLNNPNNTVRVINDSSSNSTLPLEGADRSASALLSTSEVFCTDEITSLKEHHPISPLLLKSPHLFHMYDPANDVFERSTLQ